MANLLWPGDVRAGDLFSDETFLAAMVAVEEAWLDALAGSGIAPAGVAKLDLQRLVGLQHLPVVASASERSANSVSDATGGFCVSVTYVLPVQRG